MGVPPPPGGHVLLRTENFLLQRKCEGSLAQNGLLLKSPAFRVKIWLAQNKNRQVYEQQIFYIIIQQIVTLSKYGHDALDICHP